MISIAPQAVASEGGGLGGGGPTVKAIAQLDQPSGVLIPGSSVNLEIILVQAENVLAIPLTALQQSPEGPFCLGRGRKQQSRAAPRQHRPPNPGCRRHHLRPGRNRHYHHGPIPWGAP